MFLFGLPFHFGFEILLLFNLRPNLAGQPEVTSLTKWFPFPGTYFPFRIKELFAVLAQEVGPMPHLAQCLHTIFNDRIVTLATGPTKELLIVLLAVGETILLIELRACKRGVTVCAAEVLWMPHSTHGSDGATNDGLATTSACRS